MHMRYHEEQPFFIRAIHCLLKPPQTCGGVVTPHITGSSFGSILQDYDTYTQFLVSSHCSESYDMSMYGSNT